jgi:hypothetical protein
MWHLPRYWLSAKWLAFWSAPVTHVQNPNKNQERAGRIAIATQNRIVGVIGGLRIAFVVVRLVTVAAVLWIMWHIFAPY